MAKLGSGTLRVNPPVQLFRASAVHLIGLLPSSIQHTDLRLYAELLRTRETVTFTLWLHDKIEFRLVQ